MRPAQTVVLLALQIACACSVPNGAGSMAERPRYGVVMADVGHRFELLGRAETSGRWELAGFELDELEEAFEDLEHATPPRRTPPADLHRCERQFAAAKNVALRRALSSHDRSAFAGAFTALADKCNGCHHACRYAFIEVPSTPGVTIPELRPSSCDDSP